jgi:nuclear pore complex protein Nup85
MELDAGDAANDTGYGVGRSLFSSRLAFLAGYRDFHRLYAEGQLRAAAELLVVLLTSNAAPERFWAVLLVDAIPLLEGACNAAGVAELSLTADAGADNLFTADETFELLRFLEQINSGLLSGSSDAQHFLGTLEQLLTASSSRDGADGSRSVDVGAARKRLDIVRLGLARQLARASVTGVGVL